MKYSQNVDYLVSTILYLASHGDYWARTPSGLAAELSLDAPRLTEVFDAFPGIYHRSPKPGDDGEHFYALQARYAQREGRGQEPKSIAALPTEKIDMLLNFVLTMTEQEKTVRQVRLSNWFAAGAAIVAAGAAIVVAFID